MPVKKFVNEWINCRKCSLHLNARNHCLYRGSIPAECLLIGEAPGKTEDKIGKPFIGKSGQLLSTAIKQLGINSYCITNVVCCIPLKQEYDPEVGVDTASIRPPSREEAAQCFPHIVQLIDLCKPKLIVTLGKEAEKYIPKDIVSCLLTTLRHPAYILRNGGENSVEYKRFLASFQSALKQAGVHHVNCFEPINA